MEQFQFGKPFAIVLKAADALLYSMDVHYYVKRFIILAGNGDHIKMKFDFNVGRKYIHSNNWLRYPDVLIFICGILVAARRFNLCQTNKSLPPLHVN